MSEQPVYIYALCDDTGVRYVGQTSQTLEKRVYQHLKDRSGNGRERSAWLSSLRQRGLEPTILLLEGSGSKGADEAERRQIALHRARGIALVNGTPGAHGRRRRAALPALDWSCALRLSAEDGAEVDRIGQREGTPSATVCRRLILERLEQLQLERLAPAEELRRAR